jgi:hypothetical protein
MPTGRNKLNRDSSWSLSRFADLEQPSLIPMSLTIQPDLLKLLWSGPSWSCLHSGFHSLTHVVLVSPSHCCTLARAKFDCVWRPVLDLITLYKLKPCCSDHGLNTVLCSNLCCAFVFINDQNIVSPCRRATPLQLFDTVMRYCANFEQLTYAHMSGTVTCNNRLSGQDKSLQTFGTGTKPRLWQSTPISGSVALSNNPICQTTSSLYTLYPSLFQNTHYRSQMRLDQTAAWTSHNTHCIDILIWNCPGLDWRRQLE